MDTALFCEQCQIALDATAVEAVDPMPCPVCGVIVQTQPTEMAGPAVPRQASRQELVRTLVVLFGLVGATFAVVLGHLWWVEQGLMTDPAILTFLGRLRTMSPTAAEMLADLSARGKAFPLLYLAAGLGVLGATLGVFRLGLIGGMLMFASVVAPAVFSPSTLLFTGGLVIGGLFCLLIRSSRAARPEDAPRPSPTRRLIGYLGMGVCSVVLLAYAAWMSSHLLSLHWNIQVNANNLRGLIGPPRSGVNQQDKGAEGPPPMARPLRADRKHATP